MPTGHPRRAWLLPIALGVLLLDAVALAVKPPHLRQATAAHQVAEFSSRLPDVKKREADAGQVQTILAGLSLEQKIGQLLLVGGWDLLDTSALDAIQTWHLGNLYVEGSDAKTLSDLAIAIVGCQSAALASNGTVPLLVATAQEGGSAVALESADLVAIPGASELGEMSKPEEIERAYGYLAAELLSLGINTNLAPVLDLGNEDGNILAAAGRTYGATSGTVTRSGIATIAGLQNGGVIGVARHFPGMGPTTRDPRNTLPVISYSLADLDGEDLAPFEAAVRKEVGIVQVGHLSYPHIQGERERPAWTSKVIVQRYLRDKLNYQGVVLTPDLSMPSIAQAAPSGEQAVLALKAGCDLLLHLGGPEEAGEVAEHLLEAVETGELPLDVLDAAVTRILHLKSAYGLFAAAQTEPGYLALGEFPEADAHREGMAQLYENIELRTNPNQIEQATVGIVGGGRLALPEGARILIAHVDRADFPSRYRGQTMGQLIQSRFPDAIDLPLTLSPERKSGELEELREAARAADAIVVGTWKQVGPGQRQLFQAVAEAGKPIFVISRFTDERDNRDMPDGTVQYLWIANNTRSMRLALNTLFTESLIMPASAGAGGVAVDPDAPPVTALPMPPLLEDDEEFFAEDDAPGIHDHGE